MMYYIIYIHTNITHTHTYTYIYIWLKFFTICPVGVYPLSDVDHFGNAGCDDTCWVLAVREKEVEMVSSL